jgi:hypothetical protein
MAIEIVDLPKKKWRLPKGFPITAVHWRLPSRDHSAPPPKWRQDWSGHLTSFLRKRLDWVVVEPAHINLYIYRYLCTTVCIRILYIYIVYYMMSIYIYILKLYIIYYIMCIYIYIIYYIILCIYILLYYVYIYIIILYYIE